MKKRIFNLFIILIGIVLLTGCVFKSPNMSNTKNTSTTDKPAQKSEPSGKLEKNITSSAATTARGSLIVFVTNNNNKDVDLKIEVEFYDENEKIVGSSEDYIFGVGAKAQIVSEMYDTPEKYSTYKIYTDADESIYKTYFDEIEVTDNKTDKVVAQVKNNSKDTIEYMEIAVVFYQGETVVGYDSEYVTNVKPGRSGNANFYEPYDNDYNDVEYDNYKIFVNEAYSSQN